MLVRSAALHRGFTLIELLVTVAIIALALSLGVPSFTAFQRNAELTATANMLIASMNSGRSEAMKRGMNAMVVPTDSNDWAKGWKVFVDVDRSGDPAGSANILVATQGSLPSYITITPSPNPVTFKFDASGYATSSNGSMEIKRNDVSISDQPNETRKVIVYATGRVRACKPASSSDANC
jgi:type IV fimbrial biogenesis protein FimT